MTKQTQIIEHKVISRWIKNGDYVLDLGCGDGELLSLLIRNNQVHAQGIELSDQAINTCVATGLNVYQQDIDTGLTDYADKSMDFVILNQTLQQVRKPDLAIKEALRVGKKVIVGFPNFCYIADRFSIFFRGKVPVTSSLPYEWYDTPNLHFLSITDFKEYCKKINITVEDQVFISKNHIVRVFPNLFAEVGLFLLSKNTYC